MADAARTQLRMYQIEPGRMGEFIESFRQVGDGARRSRIQSSRGRG